MIVPLFQGKYEPLCAVCTINCSKPIADLLHQKNLKIIDLYEKINSEFVVVGDRLDFYNGNIFLNKNNQKDLFNAKELAKLRLNQQIIS